MPMTRTVQENVDSIASWHEDLSRLLGALALRGPVDDTMRLTACALLAAAVSLLLSEGHDLKPELARERLVSRARVRERCAALGLTAADVHLLSADPRAAGILTPCLSMGSVDNA